MLHPSKLSLYVGPRWEASFDLTVLLASNSPTFPTSKFLVCEYSVVFDTDSARMSEHGY